MKKAEDYKRIQNQKDLREAIYAAQKEVNHSRQELENSFSGIPLHLLGGAVGLASSLFSSKKKQSVGSQTEVNTNKHTFFTNDIKDVIIQLVIMVLPKVIAKIFSKKSG